MVRSPTSWRRSVTRSSATASASCTASRPASTTSRSGCRTRPGGSCSPRSRCSGGSPRTPERPYAVVLGGSKVSDKLGVIDNLLGKADRLLIGGGMVFTFLKAQGHEVGKSLLEDDQLDVVRGYLSEAESSGVEIVLPTDIVVAPEFAADAPHDGRGGRRHARRPARASTSARSRRSTSPTCSPTRRRSSGTARWACSSWRRSPRAPGGGAGADRGRRALGGGRRGLGRGRAHARLRRRRSSATSPPVAAPAWSTWRASSSPGSTCSTTDRTRTTRTTTPRGQANDGEAHAYPADGRQLEGEPEPPARPWSWCRSWPGRWTTRSTTSARSRSSCCRRTPTCAACRRSSTATGCKIGYGAQDVSRPRRGRLHGRDHHRHADQARLHVRRRGPLGAPRVPPRGRRPGQREGAQDRRGRHDPDRVRRRGARGPAGRGARSPTRWPRSRDRWRASPPSRSPTW